MGANAIGVSLDNRSPRPLDDGGAAENAAGPKPNTAPPPAKSDAAGRVTDIGDLPTAL
jgi:hypothetical protein